MGRFADAVQTLFRPSWDAQIARQSAELRMLTAEAADMHEKFSTLLAREAKRRSRATAKQLAEMESPPDIPRHDTVVPVPTDHKAAIWQRIRAGGGAHPISRGPVNESAE